MAAGTCSLKSRALYISLSSSAKQQREMTRHSVDSYLLSRELVSDASIPHIGLLVVDNQIRSARSRELSLTIRMLTTQYAFSNVCHVSIVQCRLKTDLPFSCRQLISQNTFLSCR